MKTAQAGNKNKTDHQLGLALSGGGAKGFAHAGALKALLEENLTPDIIAGTSAGSIVGALYADGYEPEEIMQLFENKKFKQFAELTTLKGGIFKLDKFDLFLRKYLRAKKIENLQIPLKIVATNIENGRAEVFDKGPLVPALLASCAFPIIFTPVKIDGNHYVDGGLLKNFPVSTIKHSCKHIIGVNVNPINVEQYRDTLFHVAERTFHYTSIANSMPDRKICDILIEPSKVCKYNMFNLDHNSEIFTIGYESIKESFEKKNYATTWSEIKELAKNKFARDKDPYLR